MDSPSELHGVWQSRYPHLDVPPLVRSDTGSSSSSEGEEGDIEFQVDPGTPILYDPRDAILHDTVYEEPEPIALDYVLNLPHSEEIIGDESWTGSLSASLPRRTKPTTIDFLEEPEAIEHRKALLVGINYLSMPLNCQLKAHTDVDKVMALLQDVYGYPIDCIKVLKDDGIIPDDQPTIENIRREMSELVRDAAPGDRLFFYYAGHGKQVEDEDGDEEDGFDEVIVSSDIKNLIDDEIHALMVRPLPRGCRLTALVDCCKSGSILDLPYTLSINEDSSATWPNGRPIVRKQSNGDVILISACEDSASAYEIISKRKESGGALTREFINILRRNRFITHFELLNALHSRVDSTDRPQKPQLSSSRQINIHTRFHI